MSDALHDIDLSDQTIHASRLLQASATQIFDLLSHPQHFGVWWCPKGFNTRLVEFDFQPGGKCRFIVTAPDHIESAHETIFVYIAPAEQIMFKHLSAPAFTMQITLEPVTPTLTSVHWLMIFDSVETCITMKTHAINFHEKSFDRLESTLTSITNNKILKQVQKIIKK